jgi:hypothetical protein
VFIDFDGVDMNSQVRIYGTSPGSRTDGCINFEYDVTPYHVCGGSIAVTVRVDNATPSNRWYSGRGIDRNVWLTELNRPCVDDCGMFVTTPSDSGSSAGVCNHLDPCALGSAVKYRAIERQLQLLKAAGCDGLPTSHNSPDPRKLDICDRSGITFMEKALGWWKTGRNTNAWLSLQREGLMIVQAMKTAGSIVVNASSNGLSSANVTGPVAGEATPGFTAEPTSSSIPNRGPIFSGGPYSLNGMSDFMDIPDGIKNVLSGFSVGCRVRLTAITNCMRIFDFGTDKNVFMIFTPNSGNTGYTYLHKGVERRGKTSIGSVSPDRTPAPPSPAQTILGDVNGNGTVDSGAVRRGSRACHAGETRENPNAGYDNPEILY